MNKNCQDMQMKFHTAVVNHLGFLLITQQLGLKVYPLNTYLHYNTEFSVKKKFHLEKQYVLMVGMLKNKTQHLRRYNIFIYSFHNFMHLHRCLKFLTVKVLYFLLKVS